MSLIVESLQEDLTMQSALKKVFRICRNHDSLKLGASEVSRKLYQGTPLQLIVMSEDILQEYKTIIINKAEELSVPIVTVETRKELGELMPFPSKKIAAVGITDFIHESREKAFIFNASQ
ncbi:40S ribosomal protein S12 [Glugoides intestinalis]